MADKPLRLGIVGAGSIALRCPLAHLAVGDLNDRVVLGAICDPVAGRAQAAAEKFGVPQHFEDFDDMLAKGDFDIATVCSPIGVHYEQGMKLVEAGKHVHFNKTMTTTRAEADELILAAERNNVKLVSSPGQMLRPQFLRIRKLIQEGAIGVLAWAACGAGFGDYHQQEGVRQGDDVLSNIDPSWYFRKPGGGPLYDMTVYSLHTLTGVLGPARRVTAMSGILLSERDFHGKTVPCDMDDNTVILLDFGGSVFAFVHGTATGWISSLDGPVYFGTKGTIRGTRVDDEPIDYPGRERDKNGSGISLTPHAVGKHADMEEMHVFEDIMQLVQWVRDGIPSVANAEHARHVIEIFDAAYRSAQSGVAINLTTAFTPPDGA
ncbi:MAG TPA: Gfo/Idh/MocA family oxidoreductase [Polyangiaceae bacterium]|jgi:predicted dehydrogenase